MLPAARRSGADAPNLFDRKSPEKTGKKPPPGDRIGALPDEILHHVLSFLPAQEAVKTCVLARRWRNLWMSATGLRVGDVDEGALPSVQVLREFVDHFMLLRGHARLDTCEFSFGMSDEEHDYEMSDADVSHVSLWIRYALLCQVRVLRLRYISHDVSFLVSRHLTRLELESLELGDNFLSFSSCPVLQNLEITSCIIRCASISSQSLRHLSISSNTSFCYHYRTRISAPSLISLSLEDVCDRTPVLEGMPSLVEAFVGFAIDSERCFHSDHGDCGDEDCRVCYGITNDDNGSVILVGLSEATDLALLSVNKTSIFRRDLKCCPTFSKLKTLLLNDYWCVAPDFDALTCILKHSPILEKLTLQLFIEGNKHVEIKGSCSSMERSSALSEHLKIVEVKCSVVDVRVLEVLKFLCTLNMLKASLVSNLDILAGSSICGRLPSDFIQRILLDNGIDKLLEAHFTLSSSKTCRDDHLDELLEVL